VAGHQPLAILGCPTPGTDIALDHNDYIRRIGISRVLSAVLEAGAESLVIYGDGAKATERVGELLVLDRLARAETSARHLRRNGAV
jgi:predicted membrane GTPase involved in stress response